MDAASAPLSAAEFATLMLPFAPFEPAPLIAVAVSGGADSMALALLAAAWATECGGRIAALTVDHRLRPESGAEAAQVAAWLGRRGIAHTILPRDGPPIRRNIEATARAARYTLLEAWCAAAGALHLLTAHHQEDQAETLLLRLARGSGLDGLAGMSATLTRRHCRVLRPVLRVPRARLAAMLGAAGQEWVEDPTNRDPAQARARLRAAAPLAAAAGLGAPRLALAARQLGRARGTLEADAAALLARAAWLDPAGFAWLDAEALTAAPAELALRALAALIATVGGATYPPRLEALERLKGALAAGRLDRGLTLGGCQVLPRRGRVLICREPVALAPPVAAPPGARLAWDGRFLVDVAPTAPAGLMLGALGAETCPEEPVRAIPPAARPSLPALRGPAGLLAVPHLGYARPEFPGKCVALRFRPVRALTPSRFTVV